MDMHQMSERDMQRFMDAEDCKALSREEQVYLVVHNRELGTSFSEAVYQEMKQVLHARR